jgi:hypothetical protein
VTFGHGRHARQTSVPGADEKKGDPHVAFPNVGASLQAVAVLFL